MRSSNRPTTPDIMYTKIPQAGTTLTQKSWKRLFLLVLLIGIGLYCIFISTTTGLLDFLPAKLNATSNNTILSALSAKTFWTSGNSGNSSLILDDGSLFQPGADHWRTIRHFDHNGLYAFSAYYDETVFKHPVVRIVAIGKQGEKEGNIICKYNYKNTDLTASEQGWSTEISQWGDTDYTAKWITCDLPNSDVPSAVTVFTHSSLPHSLPVHYKPKLSSGSPSTINVCVRTLYGPYKNVTKLVEFVEFYKLLGATHFTFFSKNISDEVRKALLYYRRSGVVTVFNYDVPREVYVRPEGQYALIQDCFLRSRGVHQYVALVDLDEFIVPRKHSGLIPMLNHLDDDKVSSFLFACLIYCREFERNQTIQAYLAKRAHTEGVEGHFELLTQTLTKRANKPCPHTNKGKVIVKPWNVIQMDVHYIQRSTPGCYEKQVDADIAASQHYRVCPNGNYSNWRDPCPPFPFPDVDRTTHKYLSSLTLKVISVLKKAGIKIV